MAFGDISAVVDTLEFSLTDIANPDMIQISTGIYAIAYTDADGDGQLITIDIDAAGNIGATVLDSLEFDTSDGAEPSLMWVLGDIYAIAYRGVGADGFIVTVEISQAGAIGAAVIDSLEFQTIDCFEPCLIKITDAIVCVANRGPANAGILTTIDIDGSGNIGASPIHTQGTWAANLNNPHIVHVFGDIYAITYRDAAFDGWVCTMDIDTSGTIAGSITDNLEFDGVQGTFPTIARVLGNMFAIAYAGSGDDGTLITVEISDAGAVGAAPEDLLIFDAAQGVQCDIVHIGLGIVAITYTGAGTDGYLVTIQTAINGDIDPAPIGSLEFDIQDAISTSLVHVVDDIYAIAYRGWQADGFLKSLGISTPPTDGGNPALLMGIL